MAVQKKKETLLTMELHSTRPRASTHSKVLEAESRVSGLSVKQDVWLSMESWAGALKGLHLEEASCQKRPEAACRRQVYLVSVEMKEEI